ncbi:AAA family ATPase, partial [Enterococcus cecorum]|uniref:AAA family ATPase n=1 Tax=Enterococcus cecorum TaxID=44008 RepID=UPI001FAB3A01
ITQLKDKIDTWKNKVTQKLNQIKKIKEIMNEKAKDIYTTLQTSEKNNIVTMFKQQLMENGEFLNALHDCLVNKEGNLFDKLPAIEISVPSDIDTSKINSLIENNNEVANTLEDNIKQARDKLRYNRIFQLVNEYEEYNLNLRNLEILKSKKKDIEEDKDNHQKKIEELEKEIKIQRENIDKLVPNTEKKAVENINAKLKHNVPWSLTYYKGDHTGYYCIVQDGINRNVRELSTGEKNLIAFLYFIEKLEEKKDAALKQKIILFDDPMSSNDDTMQYLIISELQKLYQGKYSKKFSSDKDYMVILTHNVHFYLNVQPHGNYKDSKNKTKYDKNNFYRISDKKFIKIKNQKEDFKTNYQALWIESVSFKH